ncbi:caspase family protein [Salarchaeum sp. JOR-1]|uniref:caspase family protein n=1 Tax=Salarchaeum sp. JOR-1 TaxID=2599399 RepID=UPI001F116481|nr:caspase family protein [Salarchaeum sp. JOR-1]
MEERTGDTFDAAGIGARIDTPPHGGLSVYDPIARTRIRVETDAENVREQGAEDRFPMPLDAAVSFRTDAITFPVVVAVHVRQADGTHVTQTDHFAFEEFPAGEYVLDLAAPIKLYVRASGPMTVRSDADTTVIEFDRETRVAVGARSFHDSPAGTVTTTDDPRDVMEAVNAFGHALKTQEPARSYPTLRGHPPRLERGDELVIPPGLEAPETDVRMAVPPRFEYIYPAVSLAYYLGARLVPGETPEIRTADGFTYSLDREGGYEATVARTLKQVFVLDCVARTEGYYEVPLFERAALEASLDISFSEARAASPTERLATYLSVPFESVEPYCPTWKLTADVTPSAEYLELVPYLVDELAVVRTPTDDAVASATEQAESVREFYRATDGGTNGGRYVRPTAADSVEQTWAGEGTPIGASKAMVAAYENRVNRSLAPGDIGITVVCNETDMIEERDMTNTVYGSRDELPFDVRQHENLTQAELREVLAADTDFLHYIGHIDEEGIECADGKLALDSIETTGVDAFFLNACSSYRVGAKLVEAGAIGGIVTLSDVLNNAAVTMGKALARLLNVGYPLNVALETARNESYAGGQYVTIGDGGLGIVQPESNLPDLVEITDVRDGTVDITYRTFLTRSFDLGTMMAPTIRSESMYYLAPVRDGLEYTLSVEELVEFVDRRTPIRFDGSLHWADTFDFSRLD